MAVVKVLNIVGDSTKSWDDAVKTSVSEAAKTIDNISGIDVKNQTAVVKNGQIVEYKVNLELAFLIDDSKR